MNPYISSVGDHLWQSTLVAGVAGLLTLALRMNRARIRHWVWLVTSCKFLVPASALIAFGEHVGWRTAPEAVSSNFSVVIGEVSRTFAAPLVSSPVLAAILPGANPLPAILLVIWASGSIGLTVSWFVRWRRIGYAVRTGLPVNLVLPIKAIACPTVLEPGVFGVFRPVLLLPEGIVDRLPLAQLDAVIAHELCHVRYRDNLTAAIHMLAETLFWFHPLVWWIGKQMVKEREQACDEEVLRQGSEPRIYAEAILNVCKLYVQSPLTCLSGVTGSDLKRRIRAILAGRVASDLSLTKKAALVAASVSTLVVPFSFGMVHARVIMVEQPQIAIQAAAQRGDIALPRYREVSIKPCKAYARRDAKAGFVRSSRGSLNGDCQTVVDLIRTAYFQSASGGTDGFSYLPTWISGGPIWIGSALNSYQIEAKAEGHPSQQTMRGPMLQALLEERFKLKIHRETRESLAYSLTVAGNGIKLQPFRRGSCTLLKLWVPRPPPPGKGDCVAFIGRGTGAITGEVPNTTLEAQGISLDELSKLLTYILGSPVNDNTRVAGRFDVYLRFVTGEIPPASPHLAYASISTVLQGQLGLKLEAAKGTREFLVIDHVEKPPPG